MSPELLTQHERYNRLTAEFSDTDTEQKFRQWFHYGAVRQARLALLFAISLIALFLLIDYFLLQDSQQFFYSALIRGIIFLGGLTTIFYINHNHHPSSLDRVLLVYQFLAINLLLLLFIYLKPDIADALLSLVTITLGMYLFIPNRFIVAVGLGVFLATVFIILARVVHRIDSVHLLQWGIIISSVNIIGTAFCYRLHLIQRRGFLELMRERYAREVLQTEVARRIELEEKLRYQAHTDGLTGANNRRYFMELGREEISRSLRYDRPLSLLLIDLDHFKTINDTFGHDAGDKVLHRFSWLCRRTLREPDIFGRLGGEEFAVIIPEESLEGAQQTAERLRATVEEEFAATPYRLTISIGVAEICNTDTSISALLKRADAMMYEAKRHGRNRVVSQPGTIRKRV